MKAIVQERYGGPEVLVLSELNKPTIKDDEVLIEVHYANASSGDARVRALDAPTLAKPIMRLIFGWNGLRRKIPGVGGSGVVVEVGSKVTEFAIGDNVHFINGMKLGAYAEYVAYKESGCIVKTPDNITFQEAAPLSFGALTAFHFTNADTIKTGSSVLIYGASGSVGTYALQFAKYYGATVTAVSSKKNHELLTSIGADHTIDYTTTDFCTLNKKYDVIFDAVGKLSKSSCKSVLKESGKFLTVKSMTSEKKTLLEAINKPLSEEKLKTVLDKEYTIDETQDAHAYLDTHRKVGNIVLKIK